MQQSVLKTELKNFGFLVPHLHEFEGELRDLLIEIDKLIERKKTEWETELHNLERNLQQKIRENQDLQNLISLKEVQLKEASSKINLIESAFTEGNPEEELNSIKIKVDRMRRGYENLQKKYHRQLEAEKEQSSIALRKLEKANSFLQEELTEVKEVSQKQMNSLTKQLKEEKSKTDRLEKRCQKLQKEFESLTKRVEKERSDNHSLEGVYQSRCLALERELEMTKQLSETQMAEYKQVQRTAFERAQELHRLNTELASARNELTASSNTMCQVEHLVLRHLATLSKVSGQEMICPTSSSANTTPRLIPLSSNERECMMKEMQKKLSEVDRGFADKFKEIRRLESACQTASSTIHRLVEARTQSMQQVASLSTVLIKAIEGLQSVTKRVDNLDRVLSEKLQCTKSGLSKINQDLVKLRSVRAMTRKKCGVGSETSTQTREANGIEAAVQTAPHNDSIVDSVHQHKVQHMMDEWLSQTEHLQTVISQLTEERTDLQLRLNQQLEFAERLQKENLALSDLLTGAEQFNRTRINCPPVPSRKLSPTMNTIERRSSINSQVQTDPLPDDPPKSTRIVRFPLRKSKSSTVPPTLLLESQLNSDSQMSLVRFRPLSPLSIHTSSNNTMTITGSPPRLSAHRSSSTILDANETAIASTDDSGRPSPESRKPCYTTTNQLPECGVVQPKASGDSSDSLSPTASPSEYENFALPRSRLRSTLKSSPQHINSYGSGTTTSANLIHFDANQTRIHHNRSGHKLLPPNDATEETKNVGERETRRVQPNHEFNQPVIVDNNDPLMASGDPSLPQACSTALREFDVGVLGLNRDQIEPDHEFGDDVEYVDGDESVCYLAAKFLANEKKHSILLEQQIDAHLEVLKSQLGIRS